jgi:hypothetical protein
MLDPTPLLTFSFLEWFEKQDTKNFNLVEFGCGNSTIYFNKFFKKVTTYEDDPDYLKQIKKMKLDNVEIFPFNFNTISNPKFKKSIEEAHCILIDNNYKNISREVIAKNLIEIYNYKNLLILDNGDWNPEAYFYLKKKYKNAYDFGWRNIKNDETITTVFADRV